MASKSVNVQFSAHYVMDGVVRNPGERASVSPSRARTLSEVGVASTVPEAASPGSPPVEQPALGDKPPAGTSGGKKIFDEKRTGSK